MKCPNCYSRMERKLLDERVPGYECVNCKGIWVSSIEYSDWIEKQPASDEYSIEIQEETALPEVASRAPLLCPDCGRITRRFKIWPNVEFYLDRCGGCNGIWFDENEWEVFSDNDLVKNLNLFFTDKWQHQLKKEEIAIRFQGLYRERFGEDDYEKLKDVREWIYTNEHRYQLIAYLMDKTPYEG